MSNDDISNLPGEITFYDGAIYLTIDGRSVRIEEVVKRVEDGAFETEAEWKIWLGKRSTQATLGGIGEGLAGYLGELAKESLGMTDEEYDRYVANERVEASNLLGTLNDFYKSNAISQLIAVMPLIKGLSPDQWLDLASQADDLAEQLSTSEGQTPLIGGDCKDGEDIGDILKNSGWKNVKVNGNSVTADYEVYNDIF